MGRSVKGHRSFIGTPPIRPGTRIRDARTHDWVRRGGMQTEILFLFKGRIHEASPAPDFALTPRKTRNSNPFLNGDILILKSLITALVVALGNPLLFRADTMKIAYHVLNKLLRLSDVLPPRDQRRSESWTYKLLIVGHGSGLRLGESGVMSMRSSSTPRKAEEAFVADGLWPPTAGEIMITILFAYWPQTDDTRPGFQGCQGAKTRWPNRRGPGLPFR